MTAGCCAIPVSPAYLQANPWPLGSPFFPVWVVSPKGISRRARDYDPCEPK